MGTIPLERQGHDVKRLHPIAAMKRRAAVDVGGARSVGPTMPFIGSLTPLKITGIVLAALLGVVLAVWPNAPRQGRQTGSASAAAPRATPDKGLPAVALQEKKDTKPGPVAPPPTPAAMEQGFGDGEEATWIALFVPAGTPTAVLTKLNADVNAVIGEKAIRERLDQLGLLPVGGSPAEADTYVHSEIKKWGDVVRKIGMKVE